MAYISEEERKRTISYFANGYNFVSCKDLSEGVRVMRNSYMNDSREDLAKAIAEFISWWMLSIHPTLNGFSGVDTIHWIFED